MPKNLLPALILVPEELMPPEPALLAGKEPLAHDLSPAGEPGLCYQQPLHPLH